MKRFLTLMNTRSEADSLLIALYVLNVIDYAPEDMGEWLKKNGSAIGVEAFEGVNLADFIAEQRI